MAKVEEQIVSILENSREPLTLNEIAEQIGRSPKTVFKSLRKLFEEGKVNYDIKNRRYTLAKNRKRLSLIILWALALPVEPPALIKCTEQDMQRSQAQYSFGII